MIKVAMWIDNWLYKRWLEKRDLGWSWVLGRPQHWDRDWDNQQDHYGPKPMDLDGIIERRKLCKKNNSCDKKI
jgi:hypothetical protein